ncbi:Histone-lysine N-methyltransferase SETMAR, partial [Harpegnathos saltator]
HYCNLLDQLDAKIREKRPGLQHKQIIFHQDNAPAHTSVLSMSKFNELKYKLLDHPPYSPDLAPSELVHTSVLSMSKFNELKYKLLDRPPYSPDLAPSDFYLFRNLKQLLRGNIF